MENLIINKVAESGIVSLNLENYYPQADVLVFDLKDYLFRGMILREKDFRTALSALDWEQFRGKQIAVTCTADAIIPMWAYMLVSTYLQPIAADVTFGSKQQVVDALFSRNVAQIDTAEFQDKRVVIKGCGEISIPESVYVEITLKLRPVVKSLMYGEPCSTVPIYKKK